MQVEVAISRSSSAATFVKSPACVAAMRLCESVQVKITMTTCAKNRIKNEVIKI